MIIADDSINNSCFHWNWEDETFVLWKFEMINTIKKYSQFFSCVNKYWCFFLLVEKIKVSFTSHFFFIYISRSNLLQTQCNELIVKTHKMQSLWWMILLENELIILAQLNENIAQQIVNTNDNKSLSIFMSTWETSRNEQDFSSSCLFIYS